MDKNSSTYTIGFAAAITIVCALLLGLAATSLKPMQDINLEVDKKSKILQALSLFKPEQSKNDIRAFFGENGGQVGTKTIFVAKKAINSKGEILDLPQKAINALDLEAQMKKYPDEETKRRYPFFIQYDSSEDKKADKAAAYVIPIYGYGLWSNCYGVIAIDKDCETVKNLIYYKHGETPGLGGEIEKPKFSASFVGRSIFNNKGEVALTTTKTVSENWEVPAISGSTFTMDGVNLMLKKYLTVYDAYFKTVRAEGAK